MYYMNPWSWCEIWAAESIQNTLNPTQSNQRAETLFHNFLNYGPSPRIVYKNHDALKAYDQEIDHAIRKVELSHLQLHAYPWSGSMLGWQDEPIRDTLCKLLYIYRGDPPSRARLSIISRCILGRLAYKFDGDVIEFIKFAEQVLEDVSPAVAAGEVWLSQFPLMG
ncbi:hypothetical protein BDN72DRAFT_310595 [Pluteus cervinus]|uniref:Uncharacterized protein n=1 Tax=Pluteus cervinus TaxID=181527 RepID=A0ACD3ADA9_9AGAR|nr:hypothetical protein BDN72DRAFT_310595 [Pluteus cervinus]